MNIKTIIALVLLGLCIIVQAHAQKRLIIGMDYPFTYSQNDKKTLNCALSANFYNGQCQSIGAQHLVDYLSRKLGMTVKIYNYENKDRLSKEFLKGNVDIAFFHVNAFQTASLANKQIITPLLTSLEKNKDTGKLAGYYFTDFVVKTNSHIKDVADLKNKKIGFRCDSTSGSDIPYILLLKKYGLNPAKDLQVVYYSGIKQQVEAFQKNEVNAIAIWNRYLEHYMAAHNIEDQFSIIKRYKIPSRVFAANAEKVTSAIQQKFINIMLHMPKKYYEGLSFEGVEPYEAHNYSEVLSLLNEYHELNIQAECKKKMTFDKTVRVWTSR